MPLPKIAEEEEAKYPMLSRREIGDEEAYDDDLKDNDSCSTKVSSTAFYGVQPDGAYGFSSGDETQRKSKVQVRRSEALWTWIRWGIVVGLQSTIIMMILLHGREGKESGGETESVLKGKVVETGDDINGLYKTLSHSYTYLKPDVETYVPNMTTNDNRMEVRRNWDMLMPLGSGSVGIPEYRDHPLLGDPIADDPIRTGPLFEASWTHALHCLYYSVDSYHRLIVNGRSDKDNPHHSAHCFEYLRNSIICNLDMTLEGSMSTPDDKDRGQPHVCRNREEAVKWIERRRVDDLQDIVGP